MKQCTKCKNIFPLSNFYIVRKRNNQIFSVCKPCIIKYSTKWRMKAVKIVYSHTWWYKKWAHVRYNAKIRRKIFNLSFHIFKSLYLQKQCFYCKRKNCLFSIDRKNNNLGYTDDNCVLACRYCNKLKSNIFTFTEMIILGRALKKIYKQRSHQVL